MGTTLFHEHITARRESVYAQFPHLYDDERIARTAADQLRRVRDKGIRTICDATVAGIGRDVHLLKRVATATGVNIIAATGIYTFDDIPPYFASRSIDAMVDAFVHDIEIGIQGTNARAGFLKCATDAQVTPDVEKVLRATARAHRRTGVPIITHSNPKSGSGLRQQDIFEDEGVDLTRVVIGHSGDTDDLDYLTKVAARGSFIGLDRYGMDDHLSTERRNAALLELCERGYVDRILISQDAVCVRDREDPPDIQKLRTRWTITYLVDHVIPDLIASGLRRELVERMMTDNVGRLFGRRGRSSEVRN